MLRKITWTTIMESILANMLFIIIFAFFMLPSIIAYYRGHLHFVPILIINFVIGGTIIGWAICFVWAFSSRVKGEPRALGARFRSAVHKQVICNQNFVDKSSQEDPVSYAPVPNRPKSTTFPGLSVDGSACGSSHSNTGSSSLRSVATSAASISKIPVPCSAARM